MTAIQEINHMVKSARNRSPVLKERRNDDWTARKGEYITQMFQDAVKADSAKGVSQKAMDLTGAKKTDKELLKEEVARKIARMALGGERKSPGSYTPGQGAGR